MHLTLLVPQLLWPEPEDRSALDDLALPGLQWLLARGGRQRLPRACHEAALAGCFGLSVPAYGALRRLGETPRAGDGNADDEPGGPGDGKPDGESAGSSAAPGGSDDGAFWLCADPVHLRMHNQQIILADPSAFDLHMAEAETLTAALNHEFGAVGRFHAATPQRWYLRLKAPVDHVAEPLSVVASRRLHGDLSGKTSPLHRWLNEVQMFLFLHPLNAERQGRGQPAINSLWLWGAGTLPDLQPQGLSAVWSEDPLARGLARHAGLAAHPLPSQLTDVLAASGDHPLVLLDALQAPVLHERGDQWRERLLRLESDWFAPLRRELAGIPGGRVRSLRLLAPCLYGLLEWQITRADAWKLWRRPCPLPGLIRQIAQRAPGASA